MTKYIQKAVRKSVRETKLTTRRRAVIEMRKDCKPLREIGEVLGISHETVRSDLKAGLAELRRDSITDVRAYRDMQVARREEIIAAHKPMAVDPDHEKCMQAATIVDKNETAISKLMGTDQPTQIESKTEHSGEVKAPAMFIIHEPAVSPETGDDDGSS